MRWNDSEGDVVIVLCGGPMDGEVVAWHDYCPAHWMHSFVDKNLRVKDHQYSLDWTSGTKPPLIATYTYKETCPTRT